MAANATSWSRSASAAATAAPSILDMGTIVSDPMRGPRLGALGIGLCCGLDRAALVGEARVPVPEVRGQVVVENLGADLQEQVRPVSDQRICCFVAMRLEITWLTVDSTNTDEIVSPHRRRSP